MRKALIESILRMSEEDAIAVWGAVAQWADNQRNFIAETDDEYVTTSDRMQLTAVEAVEHAGDAFMMALASPELTYVKGSDQ